MKTRTNHGALVDLPQLLPGLAIGDHVSFFRVNHVGQAIGLRRLDGVIVALSTPNGTKARIKYHGGNHVWLHRSKITRL